MEIEDYLRKFEPAAPPGDLRARVLARSRPLRPWPLAAAAAALVALGLVNARLESGLREFVRGAAPPAGDPPQSLLCLRQEILGSQS